MSTGRFYLAGLFGITVLVLAISRWLPAEARPGVWVALGIGLAVQGPLGWWLVRAVGTPRFLGVWALGMGARFAVLGLMALVVFPRLSWPVAPALITLAAVLVVLLFFEGIVVWFKHSRTQAR
ncbi:MAG: hypothetical protein AB7I33_15340 [Gemmatimonadales bacterium]